MITKSSGKRWRTFVALVGLLTCWSAVAGSTIIEDSCVKYMETGKVYNVRFSIVDGADLWPKYSWANVLTKYAIVFWDKDEATVIDISVFGLLMDTGVNGTDLQGRDWKVARRPWC